MRTFAQKPKSTQQTTSTSTETYVPIPFVQHHAVRSLLRLHNAGGNQAGTIQAKLTANPPADIHEQEADRVADQVAPPIVHEVLAAPGQSLDAATRRFMEPRFGHDFSDLRVHTDAQAAESVEALDALAYACGSNIVFATGRYQPHTTAGRSLLAHELAHTIQQSDQTPRALPRTSQGAGEQSAEEAARNVMRGRSIPPLEKTALAVARQPLPGSFSDLPKEFDFSKVFELYFTFWGEDTRRAKGRLRSRSPRFDDPDWNEPRGAQVTTDTLAAWLGREGLGKEVAKSRLLSSHEFTGSKEAREYWANYAQNHYDDLREYQLLKENAAKIEAERRVEREQLAAGKQFQREELAKFKARTYKDYLSLGEFGYFRAEYSPSKGTLTISVPIQFDFLESVEETTQLVGDPRGNKPVELVTVKETKRWSGAEIEDWREKFIKAVEKTWSSKQTGHTLYCHRPEWESLKASVIVKVNVMGEEIPAHIKPFRTKVYRADIPPGPCHGKGECVRQGEAVFTYKAVENGGRVAAHEFGHMLGLGDEYEEKGKPPEASHSRTAAPCRWTIRAT